MVDVITNKYFVQESLKSDRRGYELDTTVHEAVKRKRDAILTTF